MTTHVKEKVAYIEEIGPTKDMLMERAQDLDIDGRSDMTKSVLVDVLANDS